MKAVGIIRNLDGLGRIVIPVQLRRLYGIEKHDPVEFFATETGIFIRKYAPGQGEPQDETIDPVEM